jgi:ribosome-associated protein
VPATDEAVQLAVTAADAADDRRATDLTILEVADILAVADVFLLATAASDRQLKAVADRVEEALRESHDRKPLRREGTPASGWMLLDFGDLVCHLLTDEQREYYALERLWGDVPRRDVRNGAREAAPMPGASAEREVEVEVLPGDVTATTAGWLDVPGDDDVEVADLAADVDDLDRDLETDHTTDDAAEER